MKWIAAVLSGLGICHLVIAADMAPSERACLQKINEEVDFVLSGIERVNKEFEQKLRDKKLADFKASEYSTQKFLDNSIRKYQRDITGELKAYPINYTLSASRSSAHKPCSVKKLQSESITIIHTYTISWERTIEKAAKNQHFFKSVEHLQ